MIDATLIYPKLPAWLWIVASFGIAWNTFGIIQLIDFITQTQASLMMKGMSWSAAELYYGLPAWMKLAFAIGSVGGLIASLALVTRRRAAAPVFAASLIGYIALFAGDYVYGVFAAIPGQMMVLTFVVAVAVGLLGASVVASRKRLIA